MNDPKLNRRPFLLSALASLGMTQIARAGEPPTPRVARLDDWRGSPDLAKLAEAFQYLQTAPLGEKPAGRNPVDGDRMYLNVIRDKTRDPKTAQFEAHRNYLDIHYLLKGHEMIGSEPATALKEAVPYKPETEATMFEVPAKYNRLILAPGDFVVFFPGQAHLPACHPDGVEEIHKVVVKLLVSSLSA